MTEQHEQPGGELTHIPRRDPFDPDFDPDLDLPGSRRRFIPAPFNSQPCSCLPNRNDPFCPRHRYAGVFRFNQTPIFCQIAYEMDLNWAARTASWLFCQHERLGEWPFPRLWLTPGPGVEAQVW